MWEMSNRVALLKYALTKPRRSETFAPTDAKADKTPTSKCDFQRRVYIGLSHAMEKSNGFI
jgi:hypothetical protein